MENSKYLRQKMGLTQLQMAELLGCSLGLFIMVENGKRRLPPEIQQVQMKLDLAITRTLAQPISTDETLGGKSQKYVQKTIKQLLVKLNALEMQQEALILKQKHLKLQLTFVAEASAEEFQDADDITALNLVIIGRKASRKIEDLELKILRQNIAISTMKLEIDLLQKI